MPVGDAVDLLRLGDLGGEQSCELELVRPEQVDGEGAGGGYIKVGLSRLARRSRRPIGGRRAYLDGPMTQILDRPAQILDRLTAQIRPGAGR